MQRATVSEWGRGEAGAPWAEGGKERHAGEGEKKGKRVGGEEERRGQGMIQKQVKRETKRGERKKDGEIQ